MTSISYPHSFHNGWQCPPLGRFRVLNLGTEPTPFYPFEAKTCAKSSKRTENSGCLVCRCFCRIRMKTKHIRHSTWLAESTVEKVKENYMKDNCSTQSEFIEKAILTYVGYLEAERNVDYLSPTILSSMKSCSDENTKRITRILFKLAVEQAVSNNLIAATINFDPSQYKALVRECEREVRKLNGNFAMIDALKWQRKMPSGNEEN